MKKSLDKLINVCNKISQNQYMTIIFQAFTPTMPLLIICSMFMIIISFPVESVANFINSIQIGEASLFNILLQGTNACFSFLGLYMVVGTAYAYAKVKNLERINLCILAMGCYFLIMGDLSTDRTGSNGIMIGIVTALFVGYIYEKIHNKGWRIALPKGTPEAVADSFISLIPSAIVICIFLLVFLVTSAFGYNTFDLINILLNNTLGMVATSVWGYMFLYLIKMVLWVFGINSAFVQTICMPYFYRNDAINLAYFTKGIGNPEILTSFFEYHYAGYGGAGSVLALVIAMFIFGKSKRSKKVRGISLIPALFNISEPLVYGLPMMLNPYIAVPFILVPIVNIGLSYFATSIGLVAFTNGASIAWTCPVIISGFLAGGISVALMQLVLVIIDVLIYAPFFIALDRTYLNQEETETITLTDADSIDLENVDL